MGVLTDSHRLIENDDHIIVATKCASAHATGEELLAMVARFQDGDYGTIPDEHDRGEYQWNSFHEFGPCWASTKPQTAPKSTSSSTTGCRRPRPCSPKSASSIQSSRRRQAMTTAFTPFTTANAVSSIDLLRPSDQAPSPEETLDVTIAAWTQAQQVEITPTPPDATQAEHFLHSRKTALQQAAEDVYMTAFENASPEHRDSLLQTLHQDRITLTGWANNQALPTLTEIDRTALRREYVSIFGFPIITAPVVRWISQVTAGHPLLEIGAGNGYLASELTNHGIDVIPTDPHLTGTEEGYRIPMAPVPSVDILPLTGADAIALHPERDILWSWPDLNAEYTHQTLREFAGRFLVYIGEDIHGNTGSPEFHHVLETNFVLADSFQIPTFPGLHDRIVLYERAHHPLARTRPSTNPHQNERGAP